MSIIAEYGALIAEHYDSDNPFRPVPADVDARLTEIEENFKCGCCGKVGGGKWGPWPGCNCLKHARHCRRCARCYTCCSCTTKEQRAAELVAENERDQKLCEEARGLCVTLGLDSLEEDHSQDDVYELARTLKRQYHAAERYLRRWNGLDAHCELFNLGYESDGTPRDRDRF